MGRHKSGKSLIQQVKETLDSKLAIGQSKYLAKLGGTHTQHIYSWETYRSYLKHTCYFVRWVKEQPVDPFLGHKPRTLEECRPFAERWIQDGIERGLSAYTLKLELSALAKLYGCKTTDFDIVTPARRRNNITRSRGACTMDKHFGLIANRDLITFCRCTGLRRAELSQIRGTDLIEQDGALYLDIHRATKGGRPRVSPVVGSEEEIETVRRLCHAAGEGKVFAKPNRNADIHSYRAEYATRIYELHRREFRDFKNERLIIHKNKVVAAYISRNGRRDVARFHELYIEVDGRTRMRSGYRDVASAYYCRHDLRGVVYDRRALFEASQALGHNRETVVAEHYLR